MLYDEKLNKLTLSIPIDVMEWVLKNGDLSDIIRRILDQRMNKEAEFFIPEYKKPKRPHRGRPRKDEDPNYVPPVKRPRGRPRKNPIENLSKSEMEKDEE